MKVAEEMNRKVSCEDAVERKIKLVVNLFELRATPSLKVLEVWTLCNKRLGVQELHRHQAEACI